MEANACALSALGRKAQENGGLLLPLMFHKIPEEIRLSICNKISKENRNLEAVLKEFKQELANRERCDYSAVTHYGDTYTRSKTATCWGKKPTTTTQQRPLFALFR